MVLTPNHLPLDPSGPLSPLILPTNGYPSPPPLRKSSTGSYSKLSEFRLDTPETEEEEQENDGSTGADNGVQGVRHVELSVDAA
jgi:hypothetical protein